MASPKRGRRMLADTRSHQVSLSAARSSLLFVWVRSGRPARLTDPSPASLPTKIPHPDAKAPAGDGEHSGSDMCYGCGLVQAEEGSLRYPPRPPAIRPCAPAGYRGLPWTAGEYASWNGVYNSVEAPLPTRRISHF